MSMPALPHGLQQHVLLHGAKWLENWNFSPRSGFVFGPVYKHFFLPTTPTIFYLLILGNKFGKVPEYYNKQSATWNCQMLMFLKSLLCLFKEVEEQRKTFQLCEDWWASQVTQHPLCFQTVSREFLHSSKGPKEFGKERARKQKTETLSLRIPHFSPQPLMMCVS